MKMIPIICHQCSKIFDIPTKEYNRQIRTGRKYFFCSLSCSASNLTHKSIKSNCLFCHTEFDTTTHKHAHKCCSLGCAHKYAQSFVDPHKISTSMKEAWNRGDFDNIKCGRPRVLTPRIYNFTCIICNHPFQRITKKVIKPIKTCSDKCFRTLLQVKARANPNCGGDTNYRKYKYNGIWMDSKWEVELATWMDSNNITWERDRKKHQFMWTDKDGNKRRYYPDFYLPSYDVYLDPKNKYLVKVDDYKINQVIRENKICLIWGLLENVKTEVDILRGV